ncbi:MAG TPA: L-lactate permease [Ruminococcaceae bacterium]|nr:L-lactate permease [Oscillospiraceae bacterium]
MELSPIVLCLLAAVPVLLLIILLVGCKWSVGRAAIVSVVVDIAIALLAFGAHPLQILVSSAKGAWSSLSIILIIWPAILMYNVVRESGAFRVIRAGIQQATPNKLLQILIIGYAFAAFLQGITGFGVPVAICAPLLIEIGVSPFWALAIAPLGEAWGNTFGTLSAAWDALAAQAGLTEAMPLYWQSALWTASFLFVMNLVSGLLVCWFYGKGPALRRGLPAVLVLSLVQGGGELLMSQVNTTLCCFIPCCLALVASLLLGRLPLYNTPWELPNSRAMEPAQQERMTEQAPEGMGILHAFSPYLVMTAFSLVCLLIPSVKRVLAGISVSLRIPAITSGGVEVTEAIVGFSPLSLTNAGVFLFLAAGFGFFYFRRRGWLQAGSGRRILQDSVKKALPSSVSVMVFLVLASIMSGTGQTAALAGGFSAVFGSYYALLAALVGMLGSFITGSNMSSNILFGSFQMTTACLVGLQPAPVLAAQTVGGSAGSLISPSKIVLGATTAGHPEMVGSIIKKLLPVALLFSLTTGAVVLLQQLMLGAV